MGVFPAYGRGVVTAQISSRQRTRNDASGVDRFPTGKWGSTFGGWLQKDVAPLLLLLFQPELKSVSFSLSLRRSGLLFVGPQASLKFLAWVTQGWLTRTLL